MIKYNVGDIVEIIDPYSWIKEIKGRRAIITGVVDIHYYLLSFYVITDIPKEKLPSKWIHYRFKLISHQLSDINDVDNVVRLLKL